MNKLRQLREEKGLKQYQLAYRSKISPGLLSGFENNRVIPRPEEKKRLARTLGKKESDIFPEKK